MHGGNLSVLLRMTKHHRFTLRELMLVVLFAALGIAGLSAGGVLASIAVGIAIVVTMGSAIVAFVGRDELRAYAIGFLVPVLSYAAIVLSIGKSELDPYDGHLPMTRLMRPAFELVVETTYVDAFTGEPVPDYDPAIDQNPMSGLGMGGGPLVSESPDRRTFTSLAHVLFAMLFGYCGAKFAVWVHTKQTRTLRSEEGRG